MAGLQTKVGQYEREVQQLRKALQRSDNYIEDLTSKQDVPTGQSAVKSKRSHLRSGSVPSSCTITSLSEDKDLSENGSATKITDDVQEEDNADPPEDASPTNDGDQKKRSSTAGDNENTMSNGHSPIVASVNTERFSLESTATFVDERASGLSSRRSSEVSLYGQDLEIPPGPLTSSLNILEPVEGEALDRPPSRGELLLLGDPSSRRQEKPPLEENLNMFTASRQLIMMSERRSRQRDVMDPTRLKDFSECSPSSSDGGKRKSLDTKSLDLDLFTSAADEDSPSNSASHESPSYSREAESGSPCFHTFSLAKIKSEIDLEHEDESAPKKPRVESDEYPDTVENDEQGKP